LGYNVSKGSRQISSVTLEEGMARGRRSDKLGERERVGVQFGFFMQMRGLKRNLTNFFQQS